MFLILRFLYQKLNLSNEFFFSQSVSIYKFEPVKTFIFIIGLVLNGTFNNWYFFLVRASRPCWPFIISTRLVIL